MHDPAYYRSHAARFRELAQDSDAQTAASLIMLAAEYEAEAERLELKARPPLTPQL